MVTRLVVLALTGASLSLTVPSARAQWDITCDPAAIPEDEPDCGYPVDTVDGGCYTSSPPAFLPIACGDVMCGTSRNSTFGDNDWYELQLVYPAVISWTAVAEFYPRIAVVDGTAGCEGAITLAYINGQPAEPTTIALAVEPGTYWFMVCPLSYMYFDCGLEYQAGLTCEPIDPGACCLPEGACSDLPQVTCDQEDGTFLGAETNCASDVCPNGPGACCALGGACTDGRTQVACEAAAGVYYGGGSACATIPCCLQAYQPFTREGEPICYDGYVDDYNGGCDPPELDLTYHYIECGDRFVGYSGTYLAPDGTPHRDMDLFGGDLWLTESTRLIWRVTPSFPAEIGFAFDCGWLNCDWVYEITKTAAPCELTMIDVPVAATTDSMWLFYVRPQAGVEVPQGAPYVADLICQPAADPYCVYQRRGDANCDNEVNGYDIDAFVVALVVGQGAWEAMYGGPQPWLPFVDCGFTCVNDCNCDGAVNGYDIDPFVQLLISGG
jgi:hypothetical protein